MWLRILGSEAWALVRDDFFVLCIVDFVREADYAESFFYFHLHHHSSTDSTHISPPLAVCNIPDQVAHFQMLSSFQIWHLVVYKVRNI
jgi:hypothetical protein